MSETITLTTGIYDLIKDQIRRKRVSKEVEDLLTEELKTAKQVIRKELPTDVVSVGKRVTVKDHSTNKEQQYLFVSPDKAKISKGKYSVMSDVALAVIGRKEGDVVQWIFKDGEKKLEVIKVEDGE